SQRWSRAAARRSVTAMCASLYLVAEDALGLHLHDHTVAVAGEVLAVVLARQLVDVVVGAAELELGDAFHLEVAVRVGAVEHRHAHAWVAAQVPAFRAPVRRVEDDVLAVGVDPDDARLRRAVLLERRDRGEA